MPAHDRVTTLKIERRSIKAKLTNFEKLLDTI